MKFIADAMLGKLAKHLRLLGFDVFYDVSLSDNDIITISLAEGRIILTRDTRFAARPLAQKHLLILNDHPEEQVRQVLQSFSLAEQTAVLTRCSVCNEPLTALARSEARDLVPPHVFDRIKSFLQCAICGRIYWKGSHVGKM